jgi:hypothetical protein
MDPATESWVLSFPSCLGRPTVPQPLFTYQLPVVAANSWKRSGNRILHVRCAGPVDEPVGDITVDAEGIARPTCALPTEVTTVVEQIPSLDVAAIPVVLGGQPSASISSNETTDPEEGHRLALARQVVGLNMAYLEAQRAGVKPADADTTVPQVCSASWQFLGFWFVH